MNPLNTVKIKDGDSYRIINESDFKPDLHQLCAGEKLSNPSKSIEIPDSELKSKLKEVESKLKDSLEQLETFKGEFIAFKNDPEAMQARIDELKKADGGTTGHLVEADQAVAESSLDTTVNEANTDYASWTVPQIKDFLASKEIGFKSSASKDELLALIPRE